MTYIGSSAARPETRSHDDYYYYCYYWGGSVAEWLTCWTQVQTGPGSNRSRDDVR